MSAGATRSRFASGGGRPITNEHRLQILAFVNSVLLVGFVVFGIRNGVGGAENLTFRILPWIGLTAVSSLMPLTSGGGPVLSLDFPLLLGASFALGPIPGAVIAFLGAMDVREFRHQVSFARAVSNRAQVGLSVAAAGTAFSLINGSHVDWLGTLLAASVAVAVDAAINFGESALTTSLASSVGVISVLQRMRFGSMRWFLFAYWSFGLIGLLVAEIYLSVGILGTVLLVGPILITREAFKKREEAERADESLQVSAEALKRVDERIAEERRDERARLAEALHDDVLQRLFDASIRAEVIRQAYLGGRLLELEEDVPSLVESINGAAGHLRQVIAGLRTSSVGHAGLVGTLELLAAHLQDEHGVRTVLSADASIRMSPESELLVYQIAREAMTNAMRHSRAAAVWVTLRRQDDWLVLVVEDDGQGFDCLAQGDLRHFGLQLMRERAAALGGRLSIRSSEGSGTVVELLFKDSH